MQNLGEQTESIMVFFKVACNFILRRNKFDCANLSIKMTETTGNIDVTCVCVIFVSLFSSPEDTTWTCAVCTFANHDALEICEMCEMPRNRSLEARA